MSAGKPLFDGVKVVDFSINVAAPTCTAMMADFGADVVKVERPKVGDDCRYFPPYVAGTSAAFLWCNRGKKSVTVDITKPEGRDVAGRLVRNADVVVESFRPGVMEQNGLGYTALCRLNPSVIMCSVSAFGQTGPLNQAGGYDIIAQAASGISSLTGERGGGPLKIGQSVADFNAAVNAFGAISAALFHRERTGEGQYLDIALLDCLFATNEYFEPVQLGMPVFRNGRHHLAGAPFGIFRGTGGWIALGVLNERLWARTCALMGRPELATDPRTNSIRNRYDNLDFVTSLVEGWLATFPGIQEACRALEEAGVPCSPVYETRDLIDHPQLVAREMVVDWDVPQAGTAAGPAVGGADTRAGAGPVAPGVRLKARGMHLKFSKTPGEMRPAPSLGQHTDEVLAAIGYSELDLARLRSAGVV